MVSYADCDATHVGACSHDVNGLRMTYIGHEEDFLSFLPANAIAHCHRFSCGRAFVEERCIRDFHRGQIHDDRLEVQQCLEPALRDLRLIRRIRGVPRRILDHVALDDRRGHRVRIPHADERAEHLVLRSHRAKIRQDLMLRLTRSDRQLALEANGCRNRRVDELVECREPDRRDHFVYVGGAWPDVPRNEGFRRGQRAVVVLYCSRHDESKFNIPATPD